MDVNLIQFTPSRLLTSLKGSLIGFNEEIISRFIHPQKKITDKDIIFASFDKSGRTWVRFFIASYVNELYQLEYDINWDNFKWLTPGPMYKREDLMLFPRTDIVKPIFSHRRTIGRFFPGRRVVYISRNFLDILVSFYFFHKNRIWHKIGEMDANQFVMTTFDLDEAINRINYFSRKLEKSLEYKVIPYEELRRDPEKGFREIIEFTPYEYNEHIFRHAMEHSSFESMQKLEISNREDVAKEKLHARRGKANKYKEYLSDDVIDHVTDLLDRKMTGVLKKYYLPG